MLVFLTKIFLATISSLQDNQMEFYENRDGITIIIKSSKFFEHINSNELKSDAEIKIYIILEKIQKGEISLEKLKDWLKKNESFILKYKKYFFEISIKEIVIKTEYKLNKVLLPDEFTMVIEFNIDNYFYMEFEELTEFTYQITRSF